MTPEEIISIRKSLCVTQEKFAVLLGTTVGTVNRWEKGKVKPSYQYTKELKALRASHGAYASRRKEFKKP